MKRHAASFVLVTLIAACSGGDDDSAPPGGPVLWDCKCDYFNGIADVVVDADMIDEHDRCSTTDPANTIEDRNHWHCDACKATATKCTR